MARLSPLRSALCLVAVALGASVPESDDDLAWKPAPQAWHQQAARIVDHRFTTFAELRTFASNAKKAGVSVLMLVQLQKSARCPGSWYNGLQLCDHINGSYPVDDGSLPEWQEMLREIKPMRLMVWWNVDYWSVQGEVWQQAVADQTSDVGRWFSYGPTATSIPKCDGNNVCFNTSAGKQVCAQGSWGSDGMYKGVKSALASFGSPTYAAYLADAMANSWSRNLGIDGYTIDCSANYGCMMQTKTAQSDFYNKIVGKARETQPQIVMSGEGYGSWDEVLNTNSQMGGQGSQKYHDVMQKAVFDGDASNLEDIASTSGADAATSVCYLHPGLDGKQPGGCPTMYFRDTSATIGNLAQHQFWVALEASSGVISEHDFDPNSVCRTAGPHPFNGCYSGKGAWWNVTNDPFDEEGESPLWAFTRHRALNRLALRTKLQITNGTVVVASTSSQADNYTAYPGENCYNGHGGDEIGQMMKNMSPLQCTQACDGDPKCHCVVFLEPSPGTCWKRTNCEPEKFEKDSATKSFSVFVKKQWAPPPPPPVMAGGALAYLKHDSMGPHGDAAIMVFNPGKAQSVTIDLSALPDELTDGSVTPYDLFTNKTADVPLTKKWTVKMHAGEYKAFGGFTLGVFAPRKGKFVGCKSTYNETSSATTLQACFLDCKKDTRCENVFVSGEVPRYTEAPAPITCTKMGGIPDPAAVCTPGSGTLINKLPSARRCASLWGTPTAPATGAPSMAAGPPCESLVII